MLICNENCFYKYLLFGTFIKIISTPVEEYFSKATVGCTVTYFVKLYDVLLVLYPLPLIRASVLLCLRSPKGGCYSTLNDLSCIFLFRKSQVHTCLPNLKSGYSSPRNMTSIKTPNAPNTRNIRMPVGRTSSNSRSVMHV